MSNLRALLHHEILLEAYMQEASNVAAPLMDMLFTNPKPVVMDEASLLVTPQTNKPAPMNLRGAPARVMEMQGKSKRAGAIFHAFNQLPLSTTVFQGLREPDSEIINEIARGEVQDQMAYFGQRHALQPEVALFKTIGNGEVFVTPDGVIQETAVSGAITCDFGVAAGHKNQLGGTIAASWATGSTLISTQIRNLKIKAAQNNVPVPDLAIANSSVRALLEANDEYETLSQASPAVAEMRLGGELVKNLFGMNWLFVDGTYENASGTQSSYIADNKVIFLPSTNRNWFRPLEGLELVPTQVGVMRSLDEALNSFQKTYGKFAYAAVNHNPVRLDLFMGNHYGWVLAEPDAIWQATVTGF